MALFRSSGYLPIEDYNGNAVAAYWSSRSEPTAPAAGRTSASGRTGAVLLQPGSSITVAPQHRKESLVELDLPGPAVARVDRVRARGIQRVSVEIMWLTIDRRSASARSLVGLPWKVQPS